MSGLLVTFGTVRRTLTAVLNDVMDHPQSHPILDFLVTVHAINYIIIIKHTEENTKL